MTYNEFKTQWIGKYTEDYSALTEEQALAYRDALNNGAAVVFVATSRKLTAVQTWGGGVAGMYDNPENSAMLQNLKYGIRLGGTYAGKSFGVAIVYRGKDNKLNLIRECCNPTACDICTHCTEYMVITSQYEQL